MFLATGIILLIEHTEKAYQGRILEIKFDSGPLLAIHVTNILPISTPPPLYIDYPILHHVSLV